MILSSSFDESFQHFFAHLRKTNLSLLFTDDIWLTLAITALQFLLPQAIRKTITQVKLHWHNKWSLNNLLPLIFCCLRQLPALPVCQNLFYESLMAHMFLAFYVWLCTLQLTDPLKQHWFSWLSSSKGRSLPKCFGEHKISWFLITKFHFIAQLATGLSFLVVNSLFSLLTSFLSLC